VRGFDRLEVEQALELHDSDLQAANTKNHPERIKPAPLASVATEEHRLRATLAPASWNVIRLTSSV
jgi:alpha-N-arabinofuranosidase